MISTPSGFDRLDMVELPRPEHMLRSTALHALFAALMSWLAIVVPAIFIHAGLRNGWRGAAGAVIGGVGILLVIALFGAVPPVGIDDLAQPLTVLLELGIPALVAVALIRRGAPLGAVLLASIGSAAAGLFAGELLARVIGGFSPYAEIVKSFRALSAETIELYRKGGFPSEAIRGMERIAKGVGDSFIPTLLVVSSSITFTFSMILVPRFAYGRWVGAGYLFRNLAFPEWLLLLFVAGGVSPLLQGSARMIGLNLLAIVIALYVIQGLAIYRAFVVKLPMGIFGSAIAYLILVLLPQLSVPLVFLMGLFDPFFDFRKLNRKETGNESHSD